MKSLGAAILFCLFIWLVVAIEVYKFKDCKKVGHTTMYCFLTGGK